MAIRTPQELRSIFVTGYRPTQQDFTDLFDTYIASINGNKPSSNGDIEVPVEYAVLDEVMATDMPSKFPKGTTVAVIDYNPTSYPGWKAVFDEANANVADGQVIIITQHFPEANLTIQEIDSIRDGTFLPSLTRASLVGQDAWDTLRGIPIVRSVNGLSPDLEGNVVVASGPQGDPGPTGPQGPIGERGPAGPAGPKGDTGLQGVAGPAGPKGDTGEQGIKGDKGDRGEIGPQGSVGPAGGVGPTGTQGAQGPKGDMGNGFAIAKVYPSLAALEADFSGTDVAVNEFVLINSQDEDNGKLYVKTATAYQFQSQLTGVKGDRGDQGIQGVTGQTGSPGPRGLQGIQGNPGPTGPMGPRGNSITLKGTVANEGALPATGVVGEAYWSGGRLYVWSEDPAEVAEPTWVRGTDLTGPAGPQGLPGPTGPMPTFSDATTTSKGVVQVGEGLSVNNGVVSTSQKQYLMAQRDASEQVISSSNTALIFNKRVLGNIPYSETTGEFTLTAGKVYRITATPEWLFSAAGGYVELALANSTNATVTTNQLTRYIATSATSNESTHGPFEILFSPTTTGGYKLKVSTIQTFTARMKHNYSRLIVQEI